MQWGPSYLNRFKSDNSAHSWLSPQQLKNSGPPCVLTASFRQLFDLFFWAGTKIRGKCRMSHSFFDFRAALAIAL